MRRSAGERSRRSCSGGRRCGTTTIFQTLSDHPQVLRPVVDKGTDYYTLHFSRGLEWYRAQMPLRATVRARSARRGHAQVFEACTYYMFHPFAIERWRMICRTPNSS